VNSIKQLKFGETPNDCEPKNRHMYRNGQISIDCSILNALMNNMRLAKFFLNVRTNFSGKIEEVLILMLFPHIRPPVIAKVEKSERIFFVSLVDNLA